MNNSWCETCVVVIDGCREIRSVCGSPSEVHFSVRVSRAYLLSGNFLRPKWAAVAMDDYVRKDTAGAVSEGLQAQGSLTENEVRRMLAKSAAAGVRVHRNR